MTYLVQHPRGTLTIRTVRPSLLRRNPPLQLRWRPHVPTHATTRLRNPVTRRLVDIDLGIAAAIEHLWTAGVETFHSCQGGPEWLMWPAHHAYVSVNVWDVPRVMELLPWRGVYADEHVSVETGHTAVRGWAA